MCYLGTELVYRRVCDAKCVNQHISMCRPESILERRLHMLVRLHVSEYSCLVLRPNRRTNYYGSSYIRNGRYNAQTTNTCGTDVIFTDSVSGDSVTNYELTLLLEASTTTRAHVCRLIDGPADCIRSVL
jgi:hypothetical protein